MITEDQLEQPAIQWHETLTPSLCLRLFAVGYLRCATVPLRSGSQSEREKEGAFSGGGAYPRLATILATKCRERGD